MLALFLVACGSATPSPDGGAGSGITPKPGGGTETGGGTTPTPSPGGGTGTGGGTTPKPEEVIKPEPDPIEADDSKVPGDWKSIDNKIKSEVKKAQGEADSITLSKSHYEDYHIEGLYIKKNTIVEYNEGKVKEIVENIGIDTTKIRLYLYENSHLEFKGNVGEIKFKSIVNYGNMYFVDKLNEPKEYVVTIVKDGVNLYPLGNRGNIYVMDGNHGSTLKIDGDYGSYKNKGNIYLGLYVSKDGEKFSTDKVHINGDATDKTKVNFIYNEGQVKGLKDNAKYYVEDKDNFVIKVGGNVPKGENAFVMTPFPEGLDVFDLKYYEKKGATDSHLWKLEKIK